MFFTIPLISNHFINKTTLNSGLIIEVNKFKMQDKEIEDGGRCVPNYLYFELNGKWCQLNTECGCGMEIEFCDGSHLDNLNAFSALKLVKKYLNK